MSIHSSQLTRYQDRLRDDDYNDVVLQAQVQAAICIPQHISESMQLQARHMFLQDTIVLTPNSNTISRGHFANLAGLLDSSAAPDGLPTAINAVALTLLANRFSTAEARPLAMAQYASSVRHVRKQILDSTYNAESLVASIALLSLYEVCCPPNRRQRNNSVD